MGAAPRSRPEPLRKLSRKERAAKAAREKGFEWGERPPSPGDSVLLPSKHDKLVKFWHEPEKPEDVQALLNLVGKKDLELWWDPIQRNWQFCRKHTRFSPGVIHRSVPHDGSLRRWQHELSRLGPSLPDLEW